eukprot:9497959-Pyramimonas_sp.AAC.1
MIAAPERWLKTPLARARAHSWSHKYGWSAPVHFDCMGGATPWAGPADFGARWSGTHRPAFHVRGMGRASLPAPRAEQQETKIFHRDHFFWTERGGDDN